MQAALPLSLKDEREEEGMTEGKKERRKEVGRCSVASSVKNYLSVNFDKFLGKSVKVR